MMFFKTDSDLWFAGFYSNNYLDRHGEIITWDAHLEYAQWLKDTGVRPPVILAHQPQVHKFFHMILLAGLEDGILTGEEYNEVLYDVYQETMFAKTETVIPVDGFMLVVAKVLPGKEFIAHLVMEAPEKWGMSHSFLLSEKDDKVLNEYRGFEFTLAPLSIVANPLTPVIFSGELMSEMAEKEISADDRELLARAFGVDSDKLMDRIKEINEMLRLRGIPSKTFSRLLDALEEEGCSPDDEEEKTEQVEKEDPSEKGFEMDTMTENTEPQVAEDAAPVVVEQPSVPEFEAWRDKLFTEMNLPGLVGALETIGSQLAEMKSALDAQQKTIEALKKTEDEKVSLLFEAPRWDDLINKTVSEPVAETDPERIAELKKHAPSVEQGEKVADNPLNIVLQKLYEGM